MLLRKWTTCCYSATSRDWLRAGQQTLRDPQKPLNAAFRAALVSFGEYPKSGSCCSIANPRGRNHALELLAHEPSSVNAKISRYVFWPLWFVVVPLVLCMLVVWLVKPAQDFTPITLFERFQWEVRD